MRRILFLLVLIVTFTGLTFAQAGSGQSGGIGGGTHGSSAGGNGTPAGSANQIQFYNTANTFGADPTLTFNPTTKAFGAKIINGISNCAAYPGTTVDQQWNNCLADAIAGTNGNTTNIADGSGLGGNFNTTAEIDFGNAAGASVSAILPCRFVYTGTMTDGLHAVANFFGGASVWNRCPAAGVANAANFAAGTGTTSLKYVCRTTTSSQPYLTLSGFTCKNTGTVATTSGIDFDFEGPLNDGTLISNVNVYDTIDTYNVKAYNVSSGSTWQNSSFNAGNQGTPFFMFTDASGYVTSLNLLNDTLVHPGAGKYAFYCLDTRASSYGKISTINIDSAYTETNPDGVTQSYNISGCGKISISHATIKCYSSTGNCTAPGVNISNAFNSNVWIEDMRFMHGQNDYTYPATAVINNNDPTPNILTDSVGNLEHYSNNSAPSRFGQISGPMFQSSIGAAIASATTIAPVAGTFHVTGTTAITTMTPPTGMNTTTGGCLTLIADGLWTISSGTGAGQFKSAQTAAVGTKYTYCFDGTLWY